jgi:hypothetical protein
MLLVLPLSFTVLRLLTPPVASPAEEAPRLETSALGERARELAAGVLVDADAIADIVLTDRAATFDVELAGEHHELRLELDWRGRVIGASVWWVGEAEGLHRYDLANALPYLMDAERLDAITVDGDVVSIEAGGEVVPLTGAMESDLEEEDWGC